ncbi:hypothetical protein NDU88_007279 [Pleurodeles waltl]|uniref:Uncharacterized protein n=1 Tax=Pleurodeles waltl TaxID=8319 RepID=A0AAV7VP91_PLEWA|nr:hypothetical protein NDU88_007279 [Pleurodeles waltl]
MELQPHPSALRRDRHFPLQNKIGNFRSRYNVFSPIPGSTHKDISCYHDEKSLVDDCTDIRGEKFSCPLHSIPSSSPN